MTSPPGPYDLLIRGGSVVDGMGEREPFTADVGVAGDRIVAIGDLSGADATRVIDATGDIVAPGFIDPHVHVETAILAEARDAIAPALSGVTTVLTAPDGFGWAPLPPTAARELWASTAAIHGPMPPGMATRTVDAYLAGFVGRTPVNVLPQIPGNALRFAGAGWADGPADGAAMDRMLGLAGEWLDAGASGLAVGLDYEPGARAGEDELATLCELVAARGGGLAAHIRYEDLGRAEGYAEMGRLARRTGIRVTLAHERRDAIGVAGMDALAAGGADAAIEAYGYNASSTHLGICLPAGERAGGPAGLAERLRRPADRRRVERLLRERLDDEAAAGDRIVFAASAERSRLGRTIHDLAAADGVDVGSFAAAVLEDDPGALFVYRHDGRLDHEAVETATWSDPRTLVASDGIYVTGRMHPRGYGTYPRVLARVVRERGTITLAAAIHAMTGRTAARYDVPDRGMVGIGAVADLVVFDPAAVADRATWDEPTAPPDGIHQVIVAGVTVVVDGRDTAARPGRVLAAVRPA